MEGLAVKPKGRKRLSTHHAKGKCNHDNAELRLHENALKQITHVKTEKLVSAIKCKAATHMFLNRGFVEYNLDVSQIIPNTFMDGDQGQATNCLNGKQLDTSKTITNLFKICHSLGPNTLKVSCASSRAAARGLPSRAGLGNSYGKAHTLAWNEEGKKNTTSGEQPGHTQKTRALIFTLNQHLHLGGWHGM